MVVRGSVKVSEAVVGDTRIIRIQTTPGKTNLSHQKRTKGWLGTSNDYSEYARGEFKSIEDARAEAHRLGFTEEDESDGLDEFEDDVLEQWVTPDAKLEHWDAMDYLSAAGMDSWPDHMTLDEAIEFLEAEAEKAGVELHDTEEALKQIATSYRDQGGKLSETQMKALDLVEEDKEATHIHNIHFNSAFFVNDSGEYFLIERSLWHLAEAQGKKMVEPDEDGYQEIPISVAQKFDLNGD